MNVGLSTVDFFLYSVADVECTGLIIGTIAARDQFLVLALIREPCLKVVLLGSGVIESTRDNSYDLVGETERLVKFFRICEHFVEGFPGLLRASEDELLDLGTMSVQEIKQEAWSNNLFKLMDAEGTPSILSVGSSLFPKICAVASIPKIISTFCPFLSTKHT